MSRNPFVTASEAVLEEFEGRSNYWLCNPDLVDAKDLQLVRAVLPEGQGHDFHYHAELEEIIYVLQGEIEQWVEQEKKVLKPGEIAHIPKGVVHASFNVGAGEAQILAILSPASSVGPAVTEVGDQEPWKSLRSQA